MAIHLFSLLIIILFVCSFYFENWNLYFWNVYSWTIIYHTIHTNCINWKNTATIFEQKIIWNFDKFALHMIVAFSVHWMKTRSHELLQKWFYNFELQRIQYSMHPPQKTVFTIFFFWKKSIYFSRIKLSF